VSDGEDRFDARELFRVLANRNVEYVTIGGIAVQAHGGPRVTRDLDVAIAASSENVERLAAALVDLDARILGPDGKRSRSVPSAALLGSSDQWHLVTSHGRLDVLTLPAHLGSFEDMRARAHEVPLGEMTVPIAHREDLLRMKLAAGRPQDIADVRLLEALEDEP
jgi:hypothetical protein